MLQKEIHGKKIMMLMSKSKMKNNKIRLKVN